MIIYHRIPFEHKHFTRNIAIIATDYQNDTRWRDWLRSSERLKHTIFFDNAVFEHCPISIDQYLKAVAEVEPTLWILPDIFNDPKGTISLTKSVLPTLSASQKATAALVIPSIRLDCLDGLAEILTSGISWVGVPYVPNIERFSVVAHIISLFPTINIHLLGALSPFELRLYRKIKNVKSCDTSIVLTTSAKSQLFMNNEWHKETVTNVADYRNVDKNYLIQNIKFLEEGV